jgi:hypothetical protein
MRKIIIILLLIMGIIIINGCSNKSEKAYGESLFTTNEPCENTKLSKLERDKCYKEKAINSKAPMSCEIIINKEIEQECIHEISKDPKYCEQYESSFKKNLCYLSYAKILKDRNICKNINDSTYYEGCIFDTETDPSVCENMQDIDLKSSCFSIVAQNINDKNLCDWMGTSGQIKTCKKIISDSN